MFSLEQRKLNLDSVAMLPGKSVISHLRKRPIQRHISEKMEVHPQKGFEHTKVKW